ncbi:MAG: DNA polymerase III subunit gamma/tau [Candidatus Omnitrophica bacterium]|nr:DNA polymerase III subunit gamma/tau [Candidatus Omnitrophota bacterium]
MSYQVLASKYRPQSFDDVVGQEAAVRTLQNSIRMGRVANAYMFCGPRGVGKTSVARLLAKTLNCEAREEKRPCDECSACREIAQGTGMDVLEIDGASNRGIDEIRALRENVKFSPSRGRYRVYIIDEVHMLTQEAFNALLKTLEEPPAHVKFIFATTESHKVLPTIMSRCQRFDFSRIPPLKIRDLLMAIAKKEGIDLSDEAALVMARYADGSLRDGIVVLDQMVSFSGKKVTAEGVYELLGMAGRAKVQETVQAIIDCDTAASAIALDSLISGGKDPSFIANALLGHFRDLMIMKTAGKPTGDMALSEEEIRKLASQAETISLEEILYVIQNISNCIGLMRATSFTRAPLEIAVVRLCMRKQAFSLTEALEKLDNVPLSRQPQGSFMDPSKTETPRPPAAGPGSRETLKQVMDAPESAVQDDSDQEETQVGYSDPSKAHWNAVLTYVKNRQVSVFTFLNEGRPVVFGKEKVIIGFAREHALSRDMLESSDNRAVVEEAVGTVIGASPRVEFSILDFLGAASKDRQKDVFKKTSERKEMNPHIENVMDVFGGQVVRDMGEGA